MRCSLSVCPHIQSVAPLLGRLAIGALFVPAGFNKLMGFAGTAQYIASAGVPFPELCAGIAVFVELFVALLFVLGYRTRLMALILAVFTAIITPIFHGDFTQMMNQMMFMKNVAIVGGLLSFVSAGAGKFAIDKE